MAKRLTDRQKKQIIADYTESGSYAATGRKHQISATTVKKVVLADPDSVRKCDQKKEQNTLAMLDYMDGKQGEAQAFVTACLAEMLKPGRLEVARLSEITTAMGTTIDKFANLGRVNESALSKLDELIEGINGAAKR